MSLRLRTALIGILIAVMAAAGAASASYVFFAQRTEQNVDESLQTVSTFFADDVRRSPFADPVLGQDLGRYSVQAIDEGGKRLPVSGIELPVTARDREVAFGRIGHILVDVSINGDTWRIRTTSTRYGAIQVAMNLDAANRTLYTLRWITLAIGASAALIAGFVSWVVTRRALAPLQELTGAVEAVAGGDLDVVVAGRGSSEVNRLAGAFNATIAALRRSRAEQQRLVQNAGHDLRTPLTSITNNIAVLRKHQLGPADAQLVLTDLATDARALKQLVDEIIDVASGTNPAEDAEPTDIVELVRAIATRHARQSGREIIVRGSSVEVDVQVQAFERAVSNLIGNAVKYSAHHQIEIDVAPTRDAVWIDVADRGEGFGEGDGALLFQRFWRGDAARSSAGSGLGLAIVKDVAERHAGSVRARRREGGGSVIGFSVSHTAR